MELWLRVGDGELTNVGTFDGDTPAEARMALADLLVACADALRSGAPVVNIDTPRPCPGQSRCETADSCRMDRNCEVRHGCVMAEAS